MERGGARAMWKSKYEGNNPSYHIKKPKTSATFPYFKSA